MIRISFVVLAIFILAPWQASPAAIYKWIDAEGNVVYSEKRPLGGRPAEEVKKHSYGVSDEQATEQLENLRDQADAQKKDREVKEEITTQKLERDETIKKNCEISRQNLTLLTSTARITLKDADGNDYYVEDSDREQKILDAKAQVDRYCT